VQASSGGKVVEMGCVFSEQENKYIAPHDEKSGELGSPTPPMAEGLAEREREGGRDHMQHYCGRVIRYLSSFTTHHVFEEKNTTWRTEVKPIKMEEVPPTKSDEIEGFTEQKT
jgi:hypothetical protein